MDSPLRLDPCVEVKPIVNELIDELVKVESSVGGWRLCDLVLCDLFVELRDERNIGEETFEDESRFVFEKRKDDLF